MDQATHISAARAPAGHNAPHLVLERWAAVHDASPLVALLAGVERPQITPEETALVEAVAQAPAHLQHAALAALDDVSAIMRAGLDALLAAHGRKADAQGAAVRLWQEFMRARAIFLHEARQVAQRPANTLLA